MTANEMKDAYSALYDYMASSNNTKYMKVFGNVMTDMMDWMIQNKPEMAMEEIAKLESIKWRNYLSQKEAETIIAKMMPKAPWARDVWKQAMTQLELPMEEEPYYNSCALWVEMNKVYSDHAQTLAEKVWMKPLSEIPTETLVKTIYALAVDNLKDADKVYSIRDYFLG